MLINISHSFPCCESSYWFYILVQQLQWLTFDVLGQCLREKNETEHRLLDSGALSVQRNPTDDQKLIKLLQEELRNYVSI
jgi:hypothetical protein